MGARSQQLDDQLKALADPTRRAILLQLAGGEATVGELCAPHAMSQPAISKHLKVLERAGLIVRRVDGQTRPCALAEGGLDTIDQFMEPLRQAMERRYTNLDALLAKMERERDDENSRGTKAKRKAAKKSPAKKATQTKAPRPNASTKKKKGSP